MKKKLIILTIILFILLLGVIWLRAKFLKTEESRKTGKKSDAKISKVENSAADEQKQNASKNYVCPKHPSVIQSHPGKCPRCGVELELAEE